MRQVNVITNLVITAVITMDAGTPFVRPASAEPETREERLNAAESIVVDFVELSDNLADETEKIYAPAKAQITDDLAKDLKDVAKLLAAIVKDPSDETKIARYEDLVSRTLTRLDANLEAFQDRREAIESVLAKVTTSGQTASENYGALVAEEAEAIEEMDRQIERLSTRLTKIATQFPEGRHEEMPDALAHAVNEMGQELDALEFDRQLAGSIRDGYAIQQDNFEVYLEMLTERERSLKLQFARSGHLRGHIAQIARLRRQNVSMRRINVDMTAILASFKEFGAAFDDSNGFIGDALVVTTGGEPTRARRPKAGSNMSRSKAREYLARFAPAADAASDELIAADGASSDATASAE